MPPEPAPNPFHTSFNQPELQNYYNNVFRPIAESYRAEIRAAVQQGNLRHAAALRQDLANQVQLLMAKYEAFVAAAMAGMRAAAQSAPGLFNSLRGFFSNLNFVPLLYFIPAWREWEQQNISPFRQEAALQMVPENAVDLVGVLTTDEHEVATPAELTFSTGPGQFGIAVDPTPTGLLTDPAFAFNGGAPTSGPTITINGITYSTYSYGANGPGQASTQAFTAENGVITMSPTSPPDTVESP